MTAPAKVTHTPGPWTVRVTSEVDRAIHWGDVRVATLEENENDPELLGALDADARLIAAAPGLLAACEAALDCWRCEGNLSDAVVAKLVAAIAAAEGGAS